MHNRDNSEECYWLQRSGLSQLPSQIQIHASNTAQVSKPEQVLPSIQHKVAVFYGSTSVRCIWGDIPGTFILCIIIKKNREKKKESWFRWTMSNFMLGSIGSFSSRIVRRIKETATRRQRKQLVYQQSFHFFLYKQAGSVCKTPSSGQQHKGSLPNGIMPSAAAREQRSTRLLPGGNTALGEQKSFLRPPAHSSA